MSTKELELDPIYSETMSPERFLEIFEKRENDVDSVRVLPARLGRRGFGRIIVRWKTPVYTHRVDLPKEEDE